MFYKLQKTGKYTYVYLVNNKREGTKIKTSVIEKLGRYDKLNDEMRALVDRSLAETKEHKPADASKALFSQKVATLFAKTISGIANVDDYYFNKLPVLRYGHLALLPIWEGEFGLKTKIHNLQRFNTEVKDWEYADLLFYLTALKVLDPSSYLNAYESKSQFLFCPWEGINLDNYYRGLDFVSKFGDRIITHAVKRHLNHTKGEIKMAFFDCTNCYFETPYDDKTWQIIRYTRKRCRELQQAGWSNEDIDNWLENKEFENELKSHLDANEDLILRMRGKSKEGRFGQPIVTVALAIDQTGFPIDAKVFVGNLSEIRTLSVMLDSLQEKYQIKDIYFVADKGLNSTDNLREIGDRGLGFVVSQGVLNKNANFVSKMLDLNGYRGFEFDGLNFSVKEGKVDSERARFKVCDHEQSSYVPLNDGSLTSSGKQKKHKIKVKCKVAFVFNPTRRERELQDLKNQLTRAQLAVTNGELMGNPYSTGWRAFIQTKKEAAKNKNDKDQYRATGIKEDVYKKREDLAGYSAIVFRHPDELDKNEVLEDEQILGTYHKLVAIEDCFRIMKNTFSIRPMNVRIKSHIEGHCLICVLALMLIKSLQVRLAADGGKVLSAEAISEALSSAMVVPDPTGEIFLNVNPRLKFALLEDLHKHKTPISDAEMEDQDKIWMNFLNRQEAGPIDIDRLLLAVGCTPISVACNRTDLRKNLKLRGYDDEVLFSPYISRYCSEMSRKVS